MSVGGSVTRWIYDAKGGCNSAATKLFARYQHRLTRLARVKMAGGPRGIADEDDIVVDAFQSFLRRTRIGSYEQIRDRDGLWRLLATMTVHKALNQIRDERREKRGGGRVWSTADAGLDARELDATLNQLAGKQPGPELRIMMAESLDRLLGLLGDDELRRIAIGKLEGYSNEEIAAAIQRSVPTVERRLRLIRDTWQEELRD
ncbi:MAG: RNA polymerase subunit sigma-70 [Planctomycetes bacterium]|nr:RNA polymerase subunit sigma-70 [Planctomycetota bacterium]